MALLSACSGKSAPQQDWRFASFHAGQAVIASDHELALVSPQGKVVRRARVAAEYAFGERAIATIDEGGAEISVDGKPCFHSSAQHVHWSEGRGFLFQAQDRVWLVDEHCREVWRHEGSGRVTLGATSIVVDCVELDAGTGRELGRGCAREPEYDPTTSSLRPLGGGYFLIVTGDSINLVARDLVGRTRWQTNWPVPSTNAEPGRGDDTAIGFVVDDRGERQLLVYDVKSGALSAALPLARRDRWIGMSGDCAFVLTERAAVCHDKHGGSVRWQVATSGDPTLLLLPDGDALLADGNPPALARLHAGRRSWQVDADERAPWHWSSQMGIQIWNHRVRAFDLATGTSVEVKP